VAAPAAVQAVGVPRLLGRLAPVAPAAFVVEAAALVTSAAEAGASDSVLNGGGGGDGSTLGPTGGMFTTATTGPSVTISYMLPASTLAAIIVSNSTGEGPGKALENKAPAIQTAVDTNPPQTASACADIADYLGLVNAQTDKKLTQAEADRRQQLGRRTRLLRNLDQREGQASQQPRPPAARRSRPQRATSSNEPAPRLRA
jgi:hypothetical protein